MSGEAKIAVLGAAGFLGRRVTEVLAATDGLQPLGVARRAAPAWAGGVSWFSGDATDPEALAACLVGVDAVVNCVAGDGATMVAATRTLCAAAASAGVRRVVHVSSMAVYGDATGLVEERRPLDPGGGWYGLAKVECESLIDAFVRAGGDAVILRPGCIHGPRSEQWTGRIARMLRRHRIGDLGAAGDGGCNIIHVDDVAAAVLAAIRRPDVAGEAFNLGDPDPGTWNGYFVAFARAIGATPVRRVSPRWLKIETKALAIPLKLGGMIASRAGMGGVVPDPLPPSLLGLWRQDIQLDHRKADASLGFARTPRDAALASAARWATTQA